jgi:NAD(P)-dependent dehydrogenase (short-subunit alcohol dehydrogenase family)
VTATGHLTVYGQPLHWPRDPSFVAFPGIPAPRQAPHAQARGLLCLWADQGDAAQVDGLVKAVVQRFGRLDIPVNNAGVFVTGSD